MKKPFGNIRVDELWHVDVQNQKDPQRLRGKRYLHVASSTLYTVTGFSLNASSDQWSIHYDREDAGERKDFSFSRDMAEFLDGRFIEVK